MDVHSAVIASEALHRPKPARFGTRHACLPVGRRSSQRQFINGVHHSIVRVKRFLQEIFSSLFVSFRYNGINANW